MAENDTLSKGGRRGAHKAAARGGAFQVVLVGAGFLADAYDLFVIDLVLAILDRLQPGGLSAADRSIVGSATLVGAVTGQLVFGFLGDYLGRKWTFLATCILIIAGAVLSGSVLWGGIGPLTLVHQLAVCRFALGVGVGGEYPLAAAIAAEDNPVGGSRGRLVAAVFSMQGWGMLLSCLLSLLFLAIGVPLERIWRMLLIIGAIPPAAVIYARSKMEESELFLAAQEGNPSAHARSAWQTMRKYWHPLIGTTTTWFILDVTFYGTGSFKTRISSFLMDSHAASPREAVWNEAVFASICCCLAIPGYLLAVAFMDRIGRYKLQFWGFLALAANFFLIAGFYRDDLPESARWGLLACFGLTFLFSNFGPNTTTFVIPIETYPTLIRATCHGVSAAAGKLGAVAGVVAFAPCEQAFGLRAVLGFCGAVCLSGAALTFFFTREPVEDLRELDGLRPAAAR